MVDRPEYKSDNFLSRNFSSKLAIAMKFLVYGVLLFFSQNAMSAVILDCVYYMNPWDTIGPAIYTCQPTPIQIGEGSNVVNVTQNHLSGKSNADVLALSMIGKEFIWIPNDIKSFFANLQLIYIDSPTLKIISKAELAFPKLNTLNIFNSSIEAIRGDALMNLPKLIRFSLVKSKLLSVGPGLLTYSTALTTVSFSGGVCITTTATTAAQITALSKELTTKCPPSIEMIGEMILESKNFKQAVKLQVDPEFSAVGERVVSVEEKIDELENLLFSLCSVHAICPNVTQLEN